MSIHLPDLNELKRLVSLYNSEYAYGQLYQFLFPLLKRFCFYLLKSRELAEEAASDVMITLWRKREELIAVENLRVYAFVIAKNVSLNILRKNGRQETISIDDLQLETKLDDLNPEQMLINDELKRQLEVATHQLPNRCQLVFKLIKEDGMSYKEVAGILHISVKTVDAHLVAAMKKLSSRLQVEYKLS